MQFHHCCPLEQFLLATPDKTHYRPPGKNPTDVCAYTNAACSKITSRLAMKTFLAAPLSGQKEFV